MIISLYKNKRSFCFLDNFLFDYDNSIKLNSIILLVMN